MENLKKRIPKRIKLHGSIFQFQEIFNSFKKAEEKAREIWKGGYGPGVKIFSGDRFTKRLEDQQYHIIYTKEVVI